MRARAAPSCSIAAIGRFDDAAERAAPAGVRRADDARPARSANSTGPQSAVETPIARPRPARHDGVGARARLRRPRRVGDHHVRRMDLVGGQEMVRRDAERRRHAGAVLRDIGRGVVRADAGIEAGIEAGRHAAFAGEEGMADAVERAAGSDRSACSMPSVILESGQRARASDRAIASALNREPMSARAGADRGATARRDRGRACPRRRCALSAAARASRCRAGAKSRLFDRAVDARADGCRRRCASAAKSTCAVRSSAPGATQRLA